MSPFTPPNQFISKLTKLFALFCLSVCCTPVFASVGNSPLAFEDGTQVVSKWYYSGNSDYWKSSTSMNSLLFEEFHRLGVTPIPLGRSEAWVQDFLFFDTSGNLILNENYPADKSIIDGSLTFEIFSEPEHGLLRLDLNFARLMGFESRLLKNLFLEGGATLSGQFSGGVPYLITTESVLGRMRRYLAQQNERTYSDQQLIELIAQEVGVSKENLFFVSADRHLDTVMTLLPNGQILLHDPSLVVPVLQEALLQAKLPFERDQIERSISFYRSNPTSQRGLINTTNNIFNALHERFRIQRVAGIFSTLLTPQSSPPERAPERQIESINFFNSVQGVSPRTNSRFFLSNRASIPHLQNYWTQILVNHGYPKEQISYWGHYSGGAGLNCAGTSRR